MRAIVPFAGAAKDKAARRHGIEIGVSARFMAFESKEYRLGCKTVKLVPRGCERGLLYSMDRRESPYLAEIFLFLLA
jgi:hypothetical protein